MKELIRIQKELKAPKSQRNNFGNYNYRSCEDILEAVKPLLGDCILTISDEIVNLGNRFYIKATATFRHGDWTHSVTAFARESEEKKGMDTAQITGACSSYARKYALNGLFCIDDTKDADATNTHGIPEKKLESETKKKAQEVKTENEETICPECNKKKLYPAQGNSLRCYDCGYFRRENGKLIKLIPMGKE